MPVLTAILFRLRGADLGLGAFRNRLIYAFGMTLACIWVHGFEWIALLFFPAWFAGVALSKWGKWFAMDNPVIDIPMMTFWGVVVTVLPAALSWYLYGLPSGLWLIAGGMMMGIVYYIAKILPIKDIKYLHRGPELGEFLFGAILGVCIK